MGLLTRLQDPGETGSKIVILEFCAAMRQVHRGEHTVADLKTRFNMDAQTQVDMDWLVGRYTALLPTARLEFLNSLQDVLILAERMMPGYTTVAEVQARIEAVSTVV